MCLFMGSPGWVMVGLYGGRNTMSSGLRGGVAEWVGWRGWLGVAGVEYD